MPEENADVDAADMRSLEDETVEETKQREMYPRRHRRQPYADKLGQPGFARRTTSTKGNGWQRLLAALVMDYNRGGI